MNLIERTNKLASKSCIAVWKQTGTLEKIESALNKIHTYVDETTKPEASREKARKEGLVLGVQYLTKECQGKLSAYGFMRDEIAKTTGKYSLHLTNDERIEAAAKVWEEGLTRRSYKLKASAHNYVLSLDPELCELLAALNISADAWLTQAGRTVMRRYQEKYYPGQRIGYLAGIHHDKKHIHWHAMLFPTTEKGQKLLVTDEGPGRRNRKPFTEMRKTAQKLIKDYFREQVLDLVRATAREPHKYTQKGLLSSLARNTIEGTQQGLSLDRKALLVENERRRLMSLPDEELRKALHTAYSYQQDRLDDAGIDRRSDPSELDKDAARIEKELAEAKAAADESFRQLRELHERRRKHALERRALFKDLSQWKSIRFNKHTMRGGAGGALDPEAGEWLRKRITQPDALGEALSKWVKDNAPTPLEKLLPFHHSSESKEFLIQSRMQAHDPYLKRAFRRMTPGKVDRPMMMLDNYLRRSTKGDNFTSDLVREVIGMLLEEQKESLEEIAREGAAIRKRISSTKTLIEGLQVDRQVVRAAKEKRDPLFLQEYNWWVQQGAEIPIDSARAVDVKTIQNQYFNSPREAARREQLQDMLLRLREHKIHADAFTPDGQIRVDAIVPNRDKQADEVAPSPEAPQAAPEWILPEQDDPMLWDYLKNIPPQSEREQLIRNAHDQEEKRIPRPRR